MAETTAPAVTTEAAPTLNHASEMKLMAEHVAQIDGNVASGSESETKEMPPAKPVAEPKAKPAAEPKKGAGTAEKKESKEATPEPAKPVASGWEAIKRAEKRQREESARAAKMLEEAKALSAGNKPLLEELRADPLAFLEKNGVEFRTLVERVVKGKPPEAKPTAEDPVLKRIAALEAQLKERDITEALGNHKNTLAETLKKEEYALLATRSDAVEQMMDFTAQYHQAHGEVLSPERVASILQDTWRDELRSLSSHAAVREILGISATPDEALTEKPKKPAGKKTLTNDLDGTVGSHKDDETSVLEDDELRAAAKLIPKDAWSKLA